MENSPSSATGRGYDVVLQAENPAFPDIEVTCDRAFEVWGWLRDQSACCRHDGADPLVDCNNFYASCARVFQPQLRGKPVVVLSNNDGRVIARSNEAKAIGIAMGEAWRICKKRLDVQGAPERDLAVRSSRTGGCAWAPRAGMRKAKVALARKLAMVLHRMLADGTSFLAGCSGRLRGCRMKCAISPETSVPPHPELAALPSILVPAPRKTCSADQNPARPIVTPARSTPAMGMHK
jgi:hypothetical protein